MVGKTAAVHTILILILEIGLATPAAATNIRPDCDPLPAMCRGAIAGGSGGGAELCVASSQHIRTYGSLVQNETDTRGTPLNGTHPLGSDFYNQSSGERHLDATCNELKAMAGENVSASWNQTRPVIEDVLDWPTEQPPEASPQESSPHVTEPMVEEPTVESAPMDPPAEPEPLSNHEAVDEPPETVHPTPANDPAPPAMSLAVSAVDPAEVVPNPGWSAAIGMVVTAMTATGLALAPSFLYNRLTKDRIANHPVRNQLLTLVKDKPGSTPLELARALSVDRKTVVHHLRILARSGHVVTHVDQDGPRFFENHGRYPEGLRRAVSCLRRKGTRDVLDALQGGGGQRSLARLALLLGVPVSTAAYRVRQLVGAGLLERKERHWTMTQQASELLSANLAPTKLPASRRAPAP